MNDKLTPKQEAIQALGMIDFMAGQLEAMDHSYMKLNGEPVIQFKAGALRAFSTSIWENLNIIRQSLASE